MQEPQLYRHCIEVCISMNNGFNLSLDLVMDLDHPKWLDTTTGEVTEEEEAVATGVDMEVEVAITLLVEDEGDIQGLVVAIEEVVAVAVLGGLLEVFEVLVEDIKIGEEVGSEEAGVVTEETSNKHKRMHALVLFHKIICNVEMFLLLSFILYSDVYVNYSDHCNSVT